MLRTSLRAASLRSFHTSRVHNAATIFRMPAMSPTMTEGGIVSWKLKSGDKFAVGDVMLEVETDKANIDVETQDDGIMWEILRNDGESGIPVGTPIAIVAEEGDDLSTLERPSLDAEPAAAAPVTAEEPAASVSAEKPAEKPVAASSAAAVSSSTLNSANPGQKLSPAVELLLHNNGISNEDAFSKIQASGPKGRILKGDVLAFLGQIQLDSVTKIAEFIKSKEHLDLSNIVLAEPTKPKEEEKAAPAAEKIEKPSNVLDLCITVDLSRFETLQNFKDYTPILIKDAISIAYQRKFPQFSEGPTPVSFATQDLFDELISPSVSEQRFEVVGVKFDTWEEESSTVSSTTTSDDIFDELVGSKPLSYKSTTSTQSTTTSLVDLDLKIKINEKLSDSKAFYKDFEQALYQLLEPIEKETV